MLRIVHETRDKSSLTLEWFSFEYCKINSKETVWPISIDVKNAVNHSELEVNANDTSIKN